jgi:hypothetical protein
VLATVLASSLPLWPFSLCRDMTYEVFTPLTDQATCATGSSSLSLSLLYRVSHTGTCSRRSILHLQQPPLRFIPLRRLPGIRQPLIPKATSPRVPCPLSVSHALRALLRLVPAGLISCRYHPWGSYPSRFIPLAEPHALSDAVSLMWLLSSWLLRHPAGLCCSPGGELQLPTAF